MKKSCLLTMMLLSVIGMKADDKVKVDLYGFVNNQMYYDDRKSMQGAQGLYNLIPLDIVKDAEGNDINAHKEIAFLSITSRIGFNLSGPELFGAATSGKIEADFTAASGSAAVLMFRQANFSFKWDNAKLLIGQAWHPMSGEIIPEVQAISIGAPFNPFNRSSQIRFDYSLFDKNPLTLSAALLYQGQYASFGPNGKTNLYQRDALTPGVYLGTTFQTGGLKIGIGAEWQRLAPKVVTNVTGLGTIKTTGALNTFSGMLQASYTNNKLSLKTKTVWGEDLSHFGICGGYGVDGKQYSVNTYKWSPLTALSSWIMCTYGKTVKVGLFGGYMTNLGGDTQFLSENLMYVYGGTSIDEMYRISPSISYNIGNFSVGAEYERTSVAYGEMQGYGNVQNSHWVTNNRLLFSTSYNF